MLVELTDALDAARPHLQEATRRRPNLDQEIESEVYWRIAKFYKTINFNHAGHKYAYFKSLVRNSLVSVIRRQRGTFEDVEPEGVLPDRSSYDLTMRELIDNLPCDDTTQQLVWKLVEGCTVREAAWAVNIPTRTAQRKLKDLKEELNGEAANHSN